MKDITKEMIAKLKVRYAHLHPLIFRRTIEKSKGLSDFFDIIESLPKFPISWDEEKRTWIKNTDLLSHKRLKKK